MSMKHSKRLEGKLTEQQKRFWSGMSIAAFVALSIFLLLAVGRPMLRFIQDPGGFRAWVDGHGVWGRIAFVGMMFFQVVVAIIPAEPVEIADG